MNSRMTEDDLLRAVVALARTAGYRVYHQRPARTARGWRTAVQGDAGFPDLVVCGRGRLIVAELKSPRGKPSVAQISWIDGLRAAGIECVVWRPEDWDNGTIDRALGCEAGVIPQREEGIR